MSLTTKDIEALENLLEKSEEFTSLVFDWVGPLHENSLLDRLSTFRMAIENTIEQLKKEETHDNV